MRTLVALAVVALVSGSVAAEKANMSKDRLLATATHAVIAKVAAIYKRTVREEDWDVTYHVAEVRVESVEKGAGIVTTDPLYVRYWTREYVGRGGPPLSTAGYRGLPKQGDRVRLYLAKNAYDGFSYENKDGGFNVIGANGFEALPAATPPPAGK
jgi:hypothetical protein